jgi:hypothetical protein
MVLANGGNSNLQIMTNKYGCTEYIGGYVGKVDLPESKAVINTALKLLSLVSSDSNYSNIYRALLNALSNGRRISSTEVALYFLEGKNGILKYSRKCVNVNTNQKQELDVTLNLDIAHEDDNAGMENTGYHINVRNHYTTFCQSQLATHMRNDVSLFSFLTSFSVEKPLPALSNGRSRVVKQIPLFCADDSTGEVTNRISFEHLDVRFVAAKRCNVVHISPWFKMDFSIDCCRKLLFLYVPWPDGDETSYPDPIHSWNELSAPEYATVCINKEIHRQQLNVSLPSRDIQNNTDDADSVSSDADSSGCFDSDEHRAPVPYRESRCHNGIIGVSIVDPEMLNSAKRFLDELKQRLMQDSSASARLSAEQLVIKETHPSQFIPHDDHDAKIILLEQMLQSLTPDQAYVVDCITGHLTDPRKGQLVGLVSGEGGTGKTQIMKVLKLWCDTLYGKVQGDVGCCTIAAPTGPAAFNVGGDTWQSLFRRGHSKHVRTSADVKGVKILRDRFNGLQLLMFDEISMIGALALWEINLRCSLACDNDDKSIKPFGGYHVMFFGDFYQLDPVNDTSLAKDPIDVKGEVHSSITLLRSAINFYFELKENVRARRGLGEITPFAQGLMHIRLGLLTDNDMAYFSTLFHDYDECISRPQHEKEIFIFAYKKSVQKHNEMCLKSLLSDPNVWGCRIIAAHKRFVKGKPVAPSAADAQRLLQMTKGNGSKEHLAYIDLAIGSRVRLTVNLAISLGLTNGAQGTILGFLYSSEPPSQENQWPRYGEMGVASASREIPGKKMCLHLFCRKNTYNVFAVVVVAWDFDASDTNATERARMYSYDRSTPNVFPISPTEVPGVSYNLGGKCWSRFQLPLVAGHGRTGHSCQGLTSHFGITVSDLNAAFFNFVYVAMSRAKQGEHTRLVAPYGQFNVFKREYCQPNAKKRETIDAFYEYLRAHFPQRQ